ncbi:MAG: glycosyltransferase family 1 protein [Candidatus Weimeria sp.]
MNKKIRILHFELSENVGGIESFLLNLYSAIDRDRYQFDFITTSDHPALGRQLEELGGHIVKVSPYRQVFSYTRDIRNVLTTGYDIVHIHKNSAANVIPFKVASEFPSTKVIAHSHNTMPNGGKALSFLHRINKSYLWKNSDIHLACSTVAGEWMYGKDKKFEIIPNGIDAQKFVYSDSESEETRKSLGISESTFVVGHVGRFTEQKNHVGLIHIFDEIHRINPDSVLLLVGDGSLKKHIEELVKPLNCRRAVRFLGIRDDVGKLLKCMDAFLMPSLYEGFPVVCIEAQAAGLYLWLSDTITKEVGITDQVEWFNLGEKNIAKRIVEKGRPRADQRLLCNQEIVRKGYDYKSLAYRIDEIYQNLSE